MNAGARVRVRWQAVRGSLWFIPAILVGASILAALLLIELSSRVDSEALLRFPRLFGASAESSRSTLSTIAGAMMTVAGVTFSITVVAVAQASSQYTPRILRTFLRDRPSQLALGTLTGVFVYCLVVLRTVRGDEDIRFIPAFAVLGAFVFAILAIAVLIYFIHHIAVSLQAEGILDRVRRETTAAVERLFPEELGTELESGSEGEVVAQAQVDAGARWEVVPARATGYLAHVDAPGLLSFAAARSTVIRMERGVGEYVVAGTPLCSLLGRNPTDEDVAALNELYAVAGYRTIEQDAAFGIRQMVDVAVKALSPGVNDTTTAVTCIDNLGAVLVHLARRRVENRLRMSDGQLRVIARGPTFDGLVSAAIDEIRRNSASNVRLLAHILFTLEAVAGSVSDEGRRKVLHDHGVRIVETAERTVADPGDRAYVREAFARFEAQLARLASVV